ncbi:unnamed protein product [Cunninghamella blakesleeana]
MKNTKQGKSDKTENSALNYDIINNKKEEKENEHSQDSLHSKSPLISYSGLTTPISATVNELMPNLSNATMLPTSLKIEQYGKYFKFSPKVSSSYALAQVYNHICHIRPPTYWNTLRTLKLENQTLTELHDLDKILPLLENLVLTNNSIQNISNFPSSTQVLKINHNNLTEIDQLSNLVKLRVLDICDNAISSFEALENLPHLHTINAENNKITSCSSFKSMHQLKKLNLRKNRISRLKFNDLAKLDSLEYLDVSYNHIQYLEAIDNFSQLKVLNLDHNEVEWITLTTALERLRVLRLCYNRLSKFDSVFCPNVHTLYLDNNNITDFMGLDRLVYLKNLSLRDQNQKIKGLDSKHIQGTQKLYLSGNLIDEIYKMLDFYSLEYLELCSLQLATLPVDFAQNLPYLTVLYLNDNYLKSIEPLKNLDHLKKLVLINNDLENIVNITNTLHFMVKLEYLDLRWNPLTMKYYSSVPWIMNRKERTCQYTSHERDKKWIYKDEQFVKQLPKQWLHRRCIFRSVIIKACPALKFLDGLSITNEELNHANNTIFNHYFYG